MFRIILYVYLFRFGQFINNDLGNIKVLYCTENDTDVQTRLREILADKPNSSNYIFYGNMGNKRHFGFVTIYSFNIVSGFMITFQHSTSSARTKINSSSIYGDTVDTLTITETNFNS